MPPPLLPNETRRLETLYSYNILDTPREHRFDRIVFMAAQVFRVPIASITFVDANRQWFKASVGFSARETPRDASFCAYTILQHGPLVVEDAVVDPLFCRNPLVVGPPFIRFYAGVPLLSEDGLPLGGLCVIDRKPRRVTTEQLRILAVLTREAEELLYPAEFRLPMGRADIKVDDGMTQPPTPANEATDQQTSAA
jgi:GAF domain-containing protein